MADKIQVNEGKNVRDYFDSNRKVIKEFAFGITQEFTKKCCLHGFTIRSPLKHELQLRKLSELEDIRKQFKDIRYQISLESTNDCSDDRTSIATDDNLPKLVPFDEPDVDVFLPPIIDDDGLENESKKMKLEKKSRKSQKSQNRYFEQVYYCKTDVSDEDCTSRHSLRLLIRCHICLTMVQQKFLSYHMFDHIFEKFYQPPDVHLCIHCLKSFETKNDLVQHYEMVAKFTKFGCYICMLSFEDDDSRMKHMKSQHFKNSMPYCCTFCKFRSSLKIQLAQHFEEYHAIPFCPFCHSVFTNDIAFNMAATDLDKKKLFDRNISLAIARHFQYHLAIGNELGCKMCELVFISKNDLKIHQILGHDQNFQKRLTKSLKTSNYMLNREQLKVVFKHSSSELDKIIAKLSSDSNTSRSNSKKRRFKNLDNSSGSLLINKSSLNEDISEKMSECEIVECSKRSSKLCFSTTFMDKGGFLSTYEAEHMIFCRECQEEFKGNEEEMRMHYNFTDELKCNYPNCKFSCYCREAMELHSHDLPQSLLFITNNEYESSTFNPNVLLSICTSCIVSPEDIMPLCLHAKGSDHIGYMVYPVPDAESELEES